MSDFSQAGIPHDFHSINKQLNKLSKIRYAALIMALIGICAYPQIEYSACKKNNISNGWNEVCGIMGGVWTPFSIREQPAKGIFYAYQMMTTVIVYFTSATISGTIFETVLHLIVRFRHVKDVFLEALSRHTPGERRRAFNKAVVYHIRVFR